MGYSKLARDLATGPSSGGQPSGLEGPVDSDWNRADDYRRVVQNYSKGPSPSGLITARSVSHAVIVVEAIINIASENLEIITGELPPAIYGSPLLMRALGSYLGRSDTAMVRILSAVSIDVDDHPLFRKLREDGFLRRVEHRVMNPEASSLDSFNFIVADSQSYRFEDRFEPYSAVAQFHDQAFGKKLSETFAAIWSMSEKS